MIIEAEKTASYLKLIANPCRLMTLCALIDGERNVSELIEITGASQTLMSNHLAVLRKAGIVDYRRDHRTLNYFLLDGRMLKLLQTLYELYCKTDQYNKEL